MEISNDKLLINKRNAVHLNTEMYSSQQLTPDRNARMQAASP